MAQSRASVDQKSLEDLLKVCHKEPIQTPGSIQPSGTLLAVDASGGIVHFSAENTESLISLSAEDLLRKPAEEVLGDEIWAGARECLHEAESGVRVDSNKHHGELHVTAFRSGDYHVIEIEPFASWEWDWLTFQDMQEELLSLTEPASLAEAAAHHVRQLTGYEHIMVYQFNKNWDGEVIAEVVGDKLPSYMGHRFPASDIPKQARKLYHEITFRIIPDVHYEPVPLLGVVDTPLDMGPAWLRSVSPIHLQYLKNMGVGASLSISILVDGRLWGLVACHHPEARLLPPYGRRMAELYGRQLSYQLSYRQKESVQTYISTHRETFRLPHKFVAEDTSLLDHLTSHGSELLDLTDAEGVVLCLYGQIETVGKVPKDEDLLGFLKWLADRKVDSLWHTDNLASHYEGASEIREQASGVLALRLPAEEDHFVVWFRPEVVETVTWGGNPHQPAVLDEDSPLGLSPRKSFASWQEQVRGRSRSWRSEHLAAAQELSGHLLEAVVAETKRQRNEQLDVIHQVLRHDVRNSATAIRLIADILSKELKEKYRSYTDQLVKASHQVADLTLSIGAFAETLHQPSRATTQTVDLRAMIRQEIEHAKNLHKHASVDLQVSPADGDFLVDASHVLNSAFRNLIGNAIVHNEKDEPRVDISLSKSESHVKVEISDNGPGIPEQKRERIFQRGYGTTEGGNTGIGLYLVHVIVDQSQGEVRVSDNDAEGTTFTVLLNPS